MRPPPLDRHPRASAGFASQRSRTGMAAPHPRLAVRDLDSAVGWVGFPWMVQLVGLRPGLVVSSKVGTLSPPDLLQSRCRGWSVMAPPQDRAPD